MPIIDPSGLFRGERLAACSDQAKLYWPYFYCASNGCARLELSYRSIISKIFTNFSKPPEASEIWQMFREYEKAYLVILYEVSGVWWAQFETSEKWLPKYKTAKDRQSPPPPLDLVDKHREGYIAWKKRNSFSYESFQKSSEDSQKFPLGVVVVDGVVEGDKALELSLLSAEPTDGLEKDADDLPKIRPEEFGNVWNRRRGALPKIETFTESRRKKVLTRMRQGLTLERFTEAVENCRVKPFLCGENDRGWTATFDWLVENDKNVEKAINNPYGGGNGARIPAGKGIENMGVSQRLIDRIERDRAAQQNGHLPAGEGGPSDTPALRGSTERTRHEGVPGGDVERLPF